jgi:hypothetical protein
MVMKNLLLALMLFFAANSFVSQAQVVVDNFDSSAVNNVYQLISEGPPTIMSVGDNHTDFQEGTGSLNLNTVIGDHHAWGSFAEIQNTAPEGEYFDWSISDSLSLWIKVYQAASLPQNMFFRFQLRDQPTPADPIEMYVYEHAGALDATTGWYNLRFSLKQITSDNNLAPGDSGFTITPTSWGLAHNNEILDYDRLVSYALVAVTNAQIVDSVKVGFDNLTRFGVRAVPYIFFNGKVLSSNLSQFTWGQSSVEVEEGTGSQAGKNSLKWTQGDEWSSGWTGAGYNIAEPLNMAGSWILDSLKFKLKAPAGTGPVRMQFESGSNGKVGTVFNPIDDDQWHLYSLPLADMVPQDGTTEFDSSAVTVFQFMAEASGVAGRVLYFDDIWTGNPVIDVIAPQAPTNVSATAGTFLNTILWTDVPGESGERYTIYYSLNPITDVEAPGVEVAKLNFGEGNELYDHLLLAPATDQNVTYYYAVTCMDGAGNMSVVSQNSAPVTNLAKGQTPVSPVPPTNFAADGDLGDWAGITPFRMFPSDGSGHIVTNTTIDGDADLSILAYVAMDNDFMYVAFDVVDDIVSTDTTLASYLIDSPDLFIGLYNWHGAPHTSLKRGEEPDYHFRFGRNACIIDNISATRILEPGPNYYWDERFTPGYVVEAKIAFSDLATIGGDNLYVPAVGNRLPIDFSANDADATGSREGILTYSPYNEDLSYQDVTRWLYTWVGDQWTGIKLEEEIADDYNLFQNYPNPFNPTTQIRYSVKESGFVNLKIYDVLGNEVATIVSQVQNPGTYLVSFDASGLSSGVYFYRIESGSFVKINKMMLLK